jgi:hypothetical protein
MRRNILTASETVQVGPGTQVTRDPTETSMAATSVTRGWLMVTQQGEPRRCTLLLKGSSCLGVFYAADPFRQIPDLVPRVWVASGTQPVSLPHTGTCGLLAILQLGVCLDGGCNFGGRTRLLRM